MTPRVIDRRGDDGNDDGVGVGDSVLVVRCPDCSHALGSVPSASELHDANLPIEVKRAILSIARLRGAERDIACELLGLTGYLGSVTLYADALFTCRRCGTVVRASGPEGRVVAERHLLPIEPDED